MTVRRLAGPALATVLMACSHQEPFAPDDPGDEGPFLPGPPARLSVWPDEETWPAWAPGGGILHSWTTGQPDGDRCVGLLPTAGGQRTLEWCASYPGHADTTDILEPAALGTEGRLAFFRERSFTGFPGSIEQELRIGDLTRRVEESTLLSAFPLPGPAGRPVVATAHLRWLGPTRLAMVLEERLVYAPCPLCDLDTLRGGRALATLDVASAPGPPTVLAGTTDASSFDPHPTTGDLYFTVVGDTRLFMVAGAGGPVSEVHDFAAAGIVRDVAVGDGAIYVAAGGPVTVVATFNGLMQEDAGGVVLRLDPVTGGVTPLTPNAGPYYHRLALSPDGAHLLAQRGGDIWLLPTALP